MHEKTPEMFTVELHCSKTRKHVLTQRDRLKLAVNFWDASSTKSRLFNHCCCCSCSFTTEDKVAKMYILDFTGCQIVCVCHPSSLSAWQYTLHDCDRILMWTHHHPQTLRPPWPCSRALSNPNLPRLSSVSMQRLFVPSSGCLPSFVYSV